MHGTLRPAWYPDWSGDVCAIVASGPSVTRENVNLLRGRCRVLVINNGHELAPWADVLYAADGRWWEHYPAARAFAGLKVTPDHDAAKKFNLQHVPLLPIENPDAFRLGAAPIGTLAHGGNSMFQAEDFNIQCGSRRHIWVGIDYCGEHWHGKHPEPLRNPREGMLIKWRARLDEQAPRLEAMGIEVINASEISTLAAYPKMSVAAALERFGVYERG